MQTLAPAHRGQLQFGVNLNSMAITSTPFLSIYAHVLFPTLYHCTDTLKYVFKQKMRVSCERDEVEVGGGGGEAEYKRFRNCLSLSHLDDKYLKLKAVNVVASQGGYHSLIHLSRRLK